VSEYIFSFRRKTLFFGELGSNQSTLAISMKPDSLTFTLAHSFTFQKVLTCSCLFNIVHYNIIALSVLYNE